MVKITYLVVQTEKAEEFVDRLEELCKEFAGEEYAFKFSEE